MNPHTRNHIARVQADELARQQTMARGWAAYHEELPAPLKPTVSKNGTVTDDDVPVNLISTLVDAGANFLAGQTPELQTADPDTAEQLQAILDRNRFATKVLNLATSGAVTGHVALKLRRDPQGPRFTQIDPANLQIITDDDDIEYPIRYVIEYQGTDRASGTPVIRRQTVERNNSTWEIVDQMQPVGGGDWITTSTETWPFAWAPIITCQNLPVPHEVFGRADVTDALIKLSQSCRFTMSNLQRIVRLHAHPKLVAKGVRLDELKGGIDSVIALPDPNASLDALHTNADIPASNALYDRMLDAVHRQGATPPIATGKVENAGQLSGLALQILYGPLLAKTQAKRTTYGELLTELGTRLLELAGTPGQAVSVVWPNPLPTDDTTDAAAATAWQAAGVSVETTLTKAGFDPAEEAARRDNEIAESVDGFASFDALTEIADGTE